MKSVIMWHRRDLRIHDNHALHQANDLLEREGTYNIKEISVDCLLTAKKLKAHMFVDTSQKITGIPL